MTTTTMTTKGHDDDDYYFAMKILQMTNHQPHDTAASLGKFDFFWDEMSLKFMLKHGVSSNNHVIFSPP